MRPASAAALFAMTVTLVALGCSTSGAPTTCPTTPPQDMSACDSSGGEALCKYACAPDNMTLAYATCSNGKWRVEEYGIACPRCTHLPCNAPSSDASAPCAPGDTQLFTPSWKPPTAFHQAQCTAAQTALLVDCLNDVPDAATCKTFIGDAANKDCLRCMVTPETAAKYGPLVSSTVTIQVNVAGCIALATSDVSATGCGAKVLALSQCEEVACESQCPISLDGNPVAYANLLACEAKSISVGCKPYAMDAACADALTADGGAAVACVQSGATFAENAKAMARLFCGGITGDGG